MIPLIDVEWMLKRPVTAVEKICGCWGDDVLLPTQVTLPEDSIVEIMQTGWFIIGLDDRSKPGNVIDTKFRDHESQVYYPRLRTDFNRHSIICLPYTPSNALDRECTSIPRARNATRITFPEVISPSCSTEYCTAGEFRRASGQYIQRPNSQIKTFISSCLHPDEIYSIHEPERE